MAGRSQTAQTASRSQAAQTASTNRAGTREVQQQASSENVGSRQEGRTDRTESRQEGSTERTQARQETAQSYAGHYDDHGHYYSDGDDWDNGEVAAVAIGAAVVGGVVGYAAGQSSTEQTTAPSTTVVYTAPPASGSGGLPCTPNTAVVNGVTYYQCGTTWYTQAYGSSGVMYMPVPAP